MMMMMIWLVYLSLQNVRSLMRFEGDNTPLLYSVIQKDALNFIRLYFLNYTRYVNDLHNI